MQSAARPQWESYKGMLKSGAMDLLFPRRRDELLFSNELATYAALATAGEAALRRDSPLW